MRLSEAKPGKVQEKVYISDAGGMQIRTAWLQHAAVHKVGSQQALEKADQKQHGGSAW